ncbi:Glycine cleavage system H protein, mitochondrial [Hypsizygus marmoreus]|uniref:Glycine cleavage system H protein n=1 Tax=Hypsizygus marmoreus TaxID=39966 RepID=A0A369K5A5_HYPMA|nr:Glycine cleavage system H protein, mitochondrial [Hypsizygus marmoreus]
MQGLLRAASRTRTLAVFPRRSSPLGFVHRAQSLRTIVTKRYTAEHETITFDDSTGIGIVTITDHAQSVLGDVVFVELSSTGTEVQQGDSIGAVESVKAASDIYAPVSGTIQEINEVLSSEPGLLNKSAEEKGWLCKIKLSDPSQINGLLTEEAYRASYES